MTAETPANEHRAADLERNADTGAILDEQRPGMRTVLLRLGRVSNLPTTWTNVLAGIYLGGGAPSVGHTLAICLAVSLFYVGGMYLNDAFDREIDERERPERPIPAGLISARTVFATGFSMLAAGTATIAVVAVVQGLGLIPIGAAAALGAAIVLYNLDHKHNPASPLLMGLCRALVYLVACLSTNGFTDGPLRFGAAALLCYLIGLTYTAKQENLRQFTNAWPLVFLAVPFVHVRALLEPAGIALYVLLLAWVGYTLTFVLRPARRSIPRAVGQFIAGISLVDGLLIAAQGQAIAAGLCVLATLLTLAAQRHVPGT